MTMRTASHGFPTVTVAVTVATGNSTRAGPPPQWPPSGPDQRLPPASLIWRIRGRGGQITASTGRPGPLQATDSDLTRTPAVAAGNAGLGSRRADWKQPGTAQWARTWPRRRRRRPTRACGAARCWRRGTAPTPPVPYASSEAAAAERVAREEEGAAAPAGGGWGRGWRETARASNLKPTP